MTRDVQRDPESMISRRTLVHGLAIAAGATMAGASGALAQQGGDLGPPSTITTPPRDFGPMGAPTTYFWDPDIIAVDPSFNDLAQPNTAIKRLYTGLLWAEGPAWSAQGRYLLWSDIPNNRQMRWSEDDGRVSVFRSPSNNSNGNSFDFQGRQLSCEHLTRRVVRYEPDGTVSVLANPFPGKGPGDTGPGGKGDMFVFDVGADNKLTNQKRFSDFMIDGVKCGPDGVRCDVNGNVWASSNAGRHVGYSGVTVWTPDGKLIGRIRLPEVCGNICFGGPKRNRLFMAASQSLYAVYTATQGAGPG